MSPPAVQRRFVGWSQPPLWAVRAAVLALASGPSPLLPAHDGQLDLRSVAVVVPGARAGRLLLAALVHRAHELGEQPSTGETAAHAGGTGLLLAPPTIITPSELPAAILRPQSAAGAAALRPADGLSRRLAWLEAVARAPRPARRSTADAPSTDDFGSDDDDGLAHAGTARLIQRTCDELAAEGLLAADVPARLAHLATTGEPALSLDRLATETARWLALAGIQADYRATLRRAGLDDPALIELDALRASSQPSPAVSAIVLAAVSELPGAARQALELFARSAPDRVLAIIPAPPESHASFDELGCIRTPSAAVPALGTPDVADERLIIVQGPGEAASRTLAELARAANEGWPGRTAPATAPAATARTPATPALAADEAVIGAPDAGIVPALLAAATSSVAGVASIPIHAPAMYPLSRSRPGTLLALAAAYLRDRSADALAALARHPDVQDALSAAVPALNRPELGPGWWLAELDAFERRHLPAVLPPADSIPSTVGQVAGDVIAAIDTLLAPLCEDRSAAAAPAPARHLLQWAEPILAVLRAVYARRRLPRGPHASPAQRRLVEALSAIRAELAGADHAPAATLGPVVSAHAAVSLLLDHAAQRTVSTPDAGAIEALGWLELPLDPAPVLVLTGLHEGVVPAPASSGAGGDPYLPNAVRRALGIACDERRLARDAFLLAVITAPRRRWSIVLSRTDAKGEPAVPSRLIFPRGGDIAGRLLPQRVLRVIGHAPAPHDGPGPTLAWHAVAAPHAHATAACPVMPIIAVGAPSTPPTAPALLGPASLPVTAFGDYLDSPYHFYLRHILRLRTEGRPPPPRAHPSADPSTFGQLLHEALRVLADPALAACTDADVLAAALVSALDDCAQRRFGTNPSPALGQQLRQARRRLRAAARAQAAHAAAGWRVLVSEWSPAQGTTASTFAHAGQSIGLTGRIDRVDLHTDGRLCILDYKTSDTAVDPTDAHRRAGRWIDLQLPLYRHLAADLIASRGSPTIHLGYFALPAALDETAIALANWSEADLTSADDAAAQVIADIRAGNFAIPGSTRPSEPALAALLGRGVLTVAAARDPDSETDDADAPEADE